MAIRKVRRLKSLCVKAWDAKTCNMTFCKCDIHRLLIDFTPNVEQSSLFNPYQLIFLLVWLIRVHITKCVCVCALVCRVEKRIHGLISQSEWWLSVICGGVWCSVSLRYPTRAVVADISTDRGDMLAGQFFWPFSGHLLFLPLF